MDDAMAAHGDTRTPPSLGSQAAVLSVGLLVGAAAAWIGTSVLLLPAAEEASSNGWLGLIFVIVAVAVTVLQALLLGAALALRGAVYSRTGRRWPVWAIAAAPAGLGFLSAVMALTESDTPVALFAVPPFVVAAALASAAWIAEQVRLPRWASITLGVLVAVVVAWLAAPLLGFGVS